MSTRIYYTVYKTTNLLNGKYYIGKHKTTTPNDYYLGSGLALKNAVKKYGKDQFVKKVICICETDEYAYLIESKLVTKLIIKDEKRKLKPSELLKADKVSNPISQSYINNKIKSKENAKITNN